jgi:hypothetical protein
VVGGELSDEDRDLIDGKPYSSVRWLDICPLKVRARMEGDRDLGEVCDRDLNVCRFG